MQDPQFTARLNRAAGPGGRTEARRRLRFEVACTLRELRPTLKQRRQHLRECGEAWCRKRVEAKRAAILGRLIIGQY